MALVNYAFLCYTIYSVTFYHYILLSLVFLRFPSIRLISPLLYLMSHLSFSFLSSSLTNFFLNTLFSSLIFLTSDNICFGMSFYFSLSSTFSPRAYFFLYVAVLESLFIFLTSLPSHSSSYYVRLLRC